MVKVHYVVPVVVRVRIFTFLPTGSIYAISIRVKRIYVKRILRVNRRTSVLIEAKVKALSINVTRRCSDIYAAYVPNYREPRHANHLGYTSSDIRSTDSSIFLIFKCHRAPSKRCQRG